MKKKKFIRKPRKNFLGVARKRFCRFCVKKEEVIIDYKDLKLLEKFITERGKITSRRMSGNCARHQRKISGAVKQARYLALLPFKKA